MIQHRIYQRRTDDCFRCCVASILGWGYDDIPNFMGNLLATSLDKRERKRMDDWFTEHDLVLLRFPIPMPRLSDVLSIIAKSQSPEVTYIVSGLTIKGVGHAQIAHKGCIVHDPAQPSQGLIAPHENGSFWTYFIGLK